MKSNIDANERHDLKIKNDEFEAVWTEIKNKNSKNIVCGCIYRHPHNNMPEFLKYMENCLRILAKENKWTSKLNQTLTILI